MKKTAQCQRCSLVLGAFLLVGCVPNPDYELDKLDNIDTSVNVFGDGIELPLGKTEQITLADALKMAKIDIDKEGSFLIKDGNGNYSIEVKGDYSLDDVIKDLHLEDLGNINGASFSKDVEYKLGDFNPEQFTIEGMEFTHSQEGFCDVNLDDIDKKMPTITSHSEIKTELNNYLPESLDLGKKMGNFEFSETLLERIGEKIVLPGYLDDNVAVPVQNILAGLNLTEFNINYQQNLDTSISLGDNASKIANVDNFKLQSGGVLKVELGIDNCPLDGGSLVPDLDLDISSMLSLQGAVSGKVDLSSMVLDSEHSWKASKAVTIASLASGFPEFDAGTLALKGLVDINGVLKIQNATAKPGKIKDLAYADMKLKAKIYLDGVKLDDMDITLAPGAGYTAEDVNVDIKIDNYDLPTGVAEVKKVYFKDDRKLSVKISAEGLGGIKSSDGQEHLSITPDVEIIFPDDLEIKEAVNKKVTISGLDLADGDITKDFTLVSVTPVNSGKKLTFNGQITAKAKVAASGTFSSKKLPVNDLVVKSEINCKPALKDYEVTLAKNELTKQVDETHDFSFYMEGMADFGTFNIKPKGSPEASLEFNLPKMTETKIVAENLVITIPEMISIDGSAIKIDGTPISSVSGCTFDSVHNTITLNGKIPAKVVIPISCLNVTPRTLDDGKTGVKGTFRIAGGITVPESGLDITRITFDEISGKDIDVKAVIPSIEAKSIEMTGDFNKSLDYEGEDIVILDAEAMKNIPEQVKSLDEVTLDKVNALIEIKVEGLPDMNGSKFFLKGTKIQLPDFLYGENDSHTLVLPDQIEITEGQAVTQTAQLTKLANVQLAGKDKITGNIKFEASLYAHNPSVDLATLKNTIKAEVKIGVGNGENADNPGKIAISKAKVKVGYDLEQKQTLSFGDVPAELKGEGVKLALNPEMHIQLSTNFGAPVKGDIILTPITADVPKESVTVTGIELPYSEDGETVKTNKYAIGANASVAQDETPIMTDLSKLLTQIPDSISVAIKVKIDDTKECVIYPRATYTCGMKYDLKVPLNFGEGFGINLNADIDVDASINDYLKFADEAKLKVDYRTTLPIGAEMEISLLDPDDKAIELQNPISFKLEKSDDGETAKDDTFDVELVFKDKAKVNLKKVHLGIMVDASENVNLNEKQYIQITKLSIGLPKGVNIETQNNK